MTATQRRNLAHDRDYEQHVGKALTEAQALFAKRARYPPLR